MGVAIDVNDDYKLIFPYVDFDFYRSLYGEIDDPVLHFIDNWETLEYDPSHFFSTSFYLSANPDVANAKINPLVHYLKYGESEGRRAYAASKLQAEFPLMDTDDSELSIAKWEIPCVFNDEKIASNPYGGMNELLAWLTDTNASAVILKRSSADWVVSFSGRGEHFFFLKKFQCFDGNVLLLRDKTHKYYCSRTNMPAIDKLPIYIDSLTGSRAGKTILFGQSYGGYCALYQSTLIKDCLTFAFSPQAFHPVLAPYNVFFEKKLRRVHPQPAPDLVKAVASASKGPRYVFAGVSETLHINDYYWGDLISGSLLASTGKAFLIVVDQNEHSTARYLDANKLFSMISDNYQMFLSDPVQASLMIARDGIYYPKLEQLI